MKVIFVVLVAFCLHMLGLGHDPDDAQSDDVSIVNNAPASSSYLFIDTPILCDGKAYIQPDNGRFDVWCAPWPVVYSWIMVEGPMHDQMIRGGNFFVDWEADADKVRDNHFRKPLWP